MRKKIRPGLIIGNWKMNKLIDETRSFVKAMAKVAIPKKVNLGIAVPFTAINPAVEALKAMRPTRPKRISIGAQNIAHATSGPYTGEVSCEMVLDAGASFALVGHSERRTQFHENLAQVRQKIEIIAKTEIVAVLCVGETFAERKSNATKDTIKTQLVSALADLPTNILSRLVVAYEPVWAIGADKPASPQEIDEVIKFCREIVNKIFKNRSSEVVSLLYGGSITPANAADIINNTSVNGLLVGGASLEVESFAKIVEQWH